MGVDDQLFPVTDTGDLEPFETRVVTTPTKPLTWSIEKYEVAQMLALSRHSLKRISEVTEVPERAIRRWQKHPEFTEYIDKVVLESAGAMKARRLRILSKILDAREALAEEHDSYESLSSKDTLAILEAMRKETEATEAAEQSNYMKTLESLIRQSSARVVDVPSTETTSDE